MTQLTTQQIINLQQEIDNLKEYINTDLCRKCAEINRRLEECERLLHNAKN